MFISFCSPASFFLSVGEMESYKSNYSRMAVNSFALNWTLAMKWYLKSSRSQKRSKLTMAHGNPNTIPFNQRGHRTLALESSRNDLRRRLRTLGEMLRSYFLPYPLPYPLWWQVWWVWPGAISFQTFLATACAQCGTSSVPLTLKIWWPSHGQICLENYIT